MGSLASRPLIRGRLVSGDLIQIPQEFIKHLCVRHGGGGVGATGIESNKVPALMELTGDGEGMGRNRQ